MKLEVKDMSIGYDRTGVLQEHISFISEDSQITAILGPNGAGKSSLLRCLLGLQGPVSGTVLVDDKELQTISAGALWNKIAYVPQALSRSGLTVGDMVLLGRSRFRSFFAQPAKEDEAAAEAAMKELGIWHLRNEACDTLSGGELRLTAIARAMTADPRLYVMDEPQSGLDLKNQWEILGLMDRFRRDGRQIIFVTHDPGAAYQAADRVLLLQKHGAPLWGSPEEILTAEHLMAAYEMESDTPVGKDVPGLFSFMEKKR